MKTKNALISRHLKFLGPEPLSKEFNLNYVIKYVINKKLTIKNLLMNQKFVSGLGNIYCNEILFLCKLNPYKIVKSIKKKDLVNIVKIYKKNFKSINYSRRFINKKFC